MLDATGRSRSRFGICDWNRQSEVTDMTIEGWIILAACLAGIGLYSSLVWAVSKRVQ